MTESKTEVVEILNEAIKLIQSGNLTERLAILKSINNKEYDCFENRLKEKIISETCKHFQTTTLVLNKSNRNELKQKVVCIVSILLNKYLGKTYTKANISKTYRFCKQKIYSFCQLPNKYDKGIKHERELIESLNKIETEIKEFINNNN